MSSMNWAALVSVRESQIEKSLDRLKAAKVYVETCQQAVIAAQNYVEEEQQRLIAYEVDMRRKADEGVLPQHWLAMLALRDRIKVDIQQAEQKVVEAEQQVEQAQADELEARRIYNKEKMALQNLKEMRDKELAQAKMLAEEVQEEEVEEGLLSKYISRRK
jgi:hypothetical protein